LEPITLVVSGVCFTSALVATSWNVARRKVLARQAPESHANVVPLHPELSYGFSKGRTKHPKDILLQALRESEQSLDIAIYALTDIDVTLEVIKARRRGVKVRVITDAGQYKQNEYQRRIVSELLLEGIFVKMNVQEDSYMHLKMAVIDGKTVVAGSFNFTMAATYKHEEVLVRINDVMMARDWHKHFDYMWNNRKQYALSKEIAERKYAWPVEPSG
jgi:phosphatidylserine/phosphatidylglycerophosphate/cardiolipin synthase-like enzyme